MPHPPRVQMTRATSGKHLPWPLLSLCALLLAGCGCDTFAARSLLITILDDRTRAPIPAGATVKVVEGTFEEVVDVPMDYGNDPVGMVFERPGRYSVTVTKGGYHTWSREGVVVSDDGCHVKTVRLEARLRTLAGP